MSRLSLKAVTELTGISEHTLRAWERRYKAVTPERDSAGRRMYTLADIEKLRLLSALVGRGHAIGKIASKTTTTLKNLLESTADLSLGRQTKFLASQTTAAAVDSLFELVRLTEMSALSGELRNAQLQFDTRQFLVEVVSPLLAKVGQAVTDGQMDVFHEHALSSLLRQQLQEILYSLRESRSLSGNDLLVFGTPEGDLHEFGILIAAIIAGLNGFSIFYVGPSVPALSLVKAADVTRATAVVLGMTTPATMLSTADLKKFVRDLRHALPESVSLIVGGSRLTEKAILNELKGATAVDSFIEFDRLLGKLRVSAEFPRIR